MLAAEQDQAEQELPKSICQPRHVRLFVLALNAGSLQFVENGQDRFPRIDSLLGPVHIRPRSAAAQTFDDRWSIIPKAHAEPAPEALDQTRQNPLAVC